MDTVKLKSLCQYSNRQLGIFTRPDEVISVREDMAEFLERDAPGCFEVYIEPKDKGFVGPPADKMIGSAPVQKPLTDFTVAELRGKLRESGLQASGNKDELIERLEAS